MGARVWEPFSRNSNTDFSTPGWANKVANRNLIDLRKSASPIPKIMNNDAQKHQIDRPHETPKFTWPLKLHILICFAPV